MKKNKTRRYESGKILMDIAKYFATVAGVGSLASGRLNWALGLITIFMSLGAWAIGFFAIPGDDGKEDK